MNERTTSSNWALGIVTALELGGVDCKAVFVELGLDYTGLTDPDARFPQDAMTRLWQRAVDISGNPAIGLNMASVVRPSSFHVVGYSLMSSRTLREGISRLVRYQRIIGEGSDINLRHTAAGYALTLRINGDRLEPAPQSPEAAMAYSLAFFRWLSGKSLTPLEVCFQHDAPLDLVPYQQTFQAPLRFAAKEYSMLFSREDLDAPLPTANEALAQLHDRFAGEYLARYGGGRVTHQARQVLCRLLPQGEPKRETVAQALLLSTRTLQRRLHEEGTSFQQLLDDSRRELAAQYLAKPDITLLEVAYLLGFADPSNFFRAFRRWFDCTPGEFRAAL